MNMSLGKDLDTPESMDPEVIVSRIQALPLFRASRASLVREAGLSINTLGQEKMSVRTLQSLMRFLLQKKKSISETMDEIELIVDALAKIEV